MIDYTLPLDQLPDPLPIEPLKKPFKVSITPPGSKSITCRAYVLAALADGESKIIRPLRADDTDNLLTALCTLGAEARWEGEVVYIKGVSGRFPRGGHVNLGDGGAPTRFMIAAACLAAEPVTVDGSARMRERPIAEGVDMLRQLGAKIEYVQVEGRLPVRIIPHTGFQGGMLTIGNTTSSQFISALMLIAPWLDRGIKLALQKSTSMSYILLTRHVIRVFGGKVRRNFRGCFSDQYVNVLKIKRKSLASARYVVEADASSSLYWAVATDLSPESYCSLEWLHYLWQQPDALAIKFLFPEGWDAYESSKEAPSLFLYAGVQFHQNDPPSRVDCSMMPDGAVALAVRSSQCNRESTFYGLHTLRHKESDRITALANELRKIGCRVETTNDSITIDPSTRHEKPVIIETYNDHRMAMAYAVLGLARPGISIRNPKCVSKSYPTFWQDFAKLYQ